MEGDPFGSREASGLIVRSVAEAEIEEAHLWYSQRSADAARRFRDELGNLFETIAGRPDQYPEIRPRLRRARMPTFPYGIYYTVSDDIVSVDLQGTNLTRDTSLGRDRTPSIRTIRTCRYVYKARCRPSRRGPKADPRAHKAIQVPRPDRPHPVLAPQLRRELHALPRKLQWVGGRRVEVVEARGPSMAESFARSW